MNLNSHFALYGPLAILGVLLPMPQLFRFVGLFGFDVGLFLEQLFSSPVAAFFGWDVIVSALVVMVATFKERHKLGRFWWLPLPCTLFVGVALGLPVYLMLRDRPFDSDDKTSYLNRMESSS